MAGDGDDMIKKRFVHDGFFERNKLRRNQEVLFNSDLMNDFDYNRRTMVSEHFERKLWIGFGIIVASIIIAGGASYYFAGDLSANAAAIVSARGALDEQNASIANLAGLKQQAAQAAQYQTAMNHLLPDQYGLVIFTQWFAGQGTQHSVSASANFQGVAIPSNVTLAGAAPFTFSATGSLANLASFMDAISARSSDFLIAVNSFNVTTVDGGYSITGDGVVFSR
jgi:Tfp pilus assembly protein PilO